MMLDFVAKLLFSYDSEKSSEKISEKFADFLQGLMSFPLNIPGTAFHKCMQVNQRLEHTRKASYNFLIFDFTH